MKSGVEPEHVGEPVSRLWRESSLSEAVQSSSGAVALAAIFSRAPTYHVNRGEERGVGMSQNIVFPTQGHFCGHKQGFWSLVCP